MLQPIAQPAALIVEKLASRRDRDMQRGRHAAAACKAAGGTAMEAALAHIDATFNESAAHNRLKLTVERQIKLGPDHPAVRARYGARVQMIRDRIARWERANQFAATVAGMPPMRPDTALTIAINLVEQWYRDERKAFQVASAFGRGSRLSLEVLSELRLLLRLARRRLSDRQFPFFIGGADMIAAE